MITTVLFDLYGTLLQLTRDSKPYVTLARHESKMYTRKALRLSLINNCVNLTDYADLIGLSSQNGIDELEVELAKDIKSAELFEDTLPVLKVLKKKQIKTVLVSNLATPYKQTVTDHNLENYFDSIVFSCDCGLVKPDPLIYQLALDRVNSPTEETIMIGDSHKSDYKGPSEIGIKSLLLVRDGDKNLELNTVSSLSDVLKSI